MCLEDQGKKSDHGDAREREAAGFGGDTPTQWIGHHGPNAAHGCAVLMCVIRHPTGLPRGRHRSSALVRSRGRTIRALMRTKTLRRGFAGGHFGRKGKICVGHVSILTNQLVNNT